MLFQPSQRTIMLKSHLHKEDKSKDNKSLELALQEENFNFLQNYKWLEEAMPEDFFQDVAKDELNLIVHALMGFELQGYFSIIRLKTQSIVLSVDSKDADLNTLMHFAHTGIKHYKTYTSLQPLPTPLTPPAEESEEGEDEKIRVTEQAFLRVGIVSYNETAKSKALRLSDEERARLCRLLKEHQPQVTEEKLKAILSNVNSRFLTTLSLDQLHLAFKMFLRAETRDGCQYEVRYNKEWQVKNAPSMNIVLAWKNTPKYNFLQQLVRIINRHQLAIKRFNASYMNTYKHENILVVSLELHGAFGLAVWDTCNVINFLRELSTFKYFNSADCIDTELTARAKVSGLMANVLRSMSFFINQLLVHHDANLYTIERIKVVFANHPALTSTLCRAFSYKFDPEIVNLESYLQIQKDFMIGVKKIDTGDDERDLCDKTVLNMGMQFVHYTLKTNAFRTSFTSHVFRLDPQLLNEVPDTCKSKFPEIPFGIFFVHGSYYIGFHIRFKELSRGGLRTVYPYDEGLVIHERNQIFSECYNLAYTQNQKNKDIPEGGSKGVLFINQFEFIKAESSILEHELKHANYSQKEIEEELHIYAKELRTNVLHYVQRSYIDSLLILINTDEKGNLRAKNIIDYYKKDEYLYLGPDENMHDEMIQWIALQSKRYGYLPGNAFISSKPEAGINHKEFGVTSLGINVYMESVLKHLSIDPLKDTFTIKVSGGPDGDVAGNLINNLYRFFPDTAKLLALVDVSGAIYEPLGLELKVMANLFKEAKPIRFYSPELLSEGGYLVDKMTTRLVGTTTQEILLWQKINGKLEQQWLSASDVNALIKQTINQTKTDLFIPAGGRPKTLDENNIHEFLDPNGAPTAKAIIEGANLYLTQKARRFLEHLGVIIIKDSSANKAGVICSSFEVLCSLTMSDEEFMQHKVKLVEEIKERLSLSAFKEANLLLKAEKDLSLVSERISAKINHYTFQLLDYLDTVDFDKDPSSPLCGCYLRYCLPTLVSKFQKQLIEKVADHHKKAIVARSIASNLIYEYGIDWEPSIVSLLPSLLRTT